jgi:hypothetical protein
VIRDILEALPEPVLIVEHGRVALANAAARAILGEAIEGEDVRGTLPQPAAIERLLSPGELMARVSAVLRRVRPALAGELLSYGDLEVDVTAHKVRRAGRSVPLGPTEFRLLRHLLEHPGRVFSRERLLPSVWPDNREIEDRTVDVTCGGCAKRSTRGPAGRHRDGSIGRLFARLGRGRMSRGVIKLSWNRRG